MPGVYRGPCDISTGVPSDVEEELGDSKAYWSGIKLGPIGFTDAAAKAAKAAEAVIA